jgi:hypothetical protein
LIVIQGFHCNISIYIYIYYTLIWFISSIILHPNPFPFLKWLQQVSMFHIHTCIENISTRLTLLCFTLFIYPPLECPPLNRTYLHSCTLLFKCVFFVQWWFYLGILPINILWLNESNPSPLLSESLRRAQSHIKYAHFIIVNSQQVPGLRYLL